MGIIDDIFRTRIEIDGNQAINELGVLENKASELKNQIKNTQKETDAYKQMAGSLKYLEKDLAKLTAQYEKQGDKIKYLKNQISPLETEMLKLEAAGQKGSEAYMKLQRGVENYTRELKFAEQQRTRTFHEMNSVSVSIANVQKQIKVTQQFTDEYQNLEKQLKETNEASTKLRDKLGLEGLTPKQLRDYRNELQRNIDHVTFGTDEYRKFEKKIQEVNTVIDQQKKALAQKMVVDISASQATNELDRLKAEAMALEKQLATMPKHTEEYHQLAMAIKDAEAEQHQLNEEYQQQLRLKEQLSQKAKDYTAKIIALEDAGKEDSPEHIKLIDESTINDEAIEKVDEKLRNLSENIQYAKDEQTSLNEELQKTPKYTEEWANKNQQLNNVNNQISAVKTNLKGLTFRQLTEYRNELQGLIDNVVHGTFEHEQLKKKLQEVNAEIRSQRDDLNDNRSRWDRLRDSWVEIRNTAIGTFLGDIHVAIFEKIVQSLADAVGNAGKLSDELADIEKFGGMTAQEAQTLNSNLGNVNTRTSTGDLRQIAIGGGTLGVPKEELKEFTIEIDKANVALAKEFDGNAERVTLTLGKLKTLFEETKDLQFGEAMSRIGSALAAAGAASSASAPQVAEFAQRIGQLGTLAPSITETLGLGAALTGDLGLNADSAAGGLTNLFIVAGQESKAFADQIGITQQAFIDLLNNDPNEMLLRLAKSMKGLSNEQVVAAMTRMKIGSQESIKVMSLLKDQTEFVVEQQKLMAEEFQKNTMLQEAFDARMKTFGATVDLAKKEINGLSAGISNALLPAMTSMLAMVVKLVILLKELPKFISDNRNTIIALTVALVGFNLQAVIAQANTLRMAFNFATFQAAMRAASIAINIAKVAQYGLNVAMMANPIGLVVGAVGLLVAGFMELYEHSERFRIVVDTTWKYLKAYGQFLLEWNIFVVAYDLLTRIDFAKPFREIGAVWDSFTGSIRNTYDKIAQFKDSVLNLFGSIATFVSTQVSNAIVPRLEKVGEGFKGLGSIFTSFIDDIANTSFGEAVGRVNEGFVQLGEIFKQGYTDIVSFDYQGFATSVGNSIANFFTEIGKTIQAKAIKVAEGFTGLASIFVSAWDDTVNLVNALINGSFGQAVARVKEGFIALGSIFTDFGKDVKATYEEIVKYVTDFLASIYESVNDFAQENFGEELKAVQTAWQDLQGAVQVITDSFGELKTAIQDVFGLLKSNVLTEFVNRANTSVSNFKAQTQTPAQKPLVYARSSQFDIAAAYQPQIPTLPSSPKKPEKSAEDKALEEENRKRAEALAQKDKEKEDKDKEKAKKLAEERKKATAEALKQIDELQRQMMGESLYRQLLEVEAKYQEMGEKAAEQYKKGFISKDTYTQLIDLQRQNLEREKTELKDAFLKKGYDAVMSEAEGRQKAWEEVKNMELQRLKNEQNLRDTQTGIEALGKIADVMGNTDLTRNNPEEQNRQVGEIEREAQQKKLDSEKSYLQDELAVNAEFGDLTIAQEDAIKLRLAEIEKEKVAIRRASLQEQMDLQEKHFEQVKTGLNKLGNAFGQINQYSQQLGFEGTIFSKGLGLSQIAISTAVATVEAIQGAVSAAKAGGPAAPFLMAGFIASAIGTVTAAIAQAKAIIDPVQPPKPKQNNNAGGYFFDGGDTGGTSIYEERGVVHGKEYVIPNWLRKRPEVARFENIIESVRVSKDLSKLKALELFNQTAAPTTSSPTSTPVSTQNNDNQLATSMQQLIALQQEQIKVIQNFGGRLRVVATDVQTGLDEINQLDKEANF